GRHDLVLLVEAVVVLDPDLFLVVGGAVAHALEVVLHDVVILLAVEHPPAELAVAVVEVEELGVLVLRLRDGAVDVLGEGRRLVRTAGAAAPAGRESTAEPWRRRRHGSRRGSRSRGSRGRAV